VSQDTQEITVTRKPKWVEVDEDLWAKMKSAAALKKLTLSDAIEQAIEGWLEAA
jgi:macrodomain Ter protein organizer (MatP/YcbG family)